jgi:hypothetical protein
MERKEGFYWMQFRANTGMTTIGYWSGYSWDVLGLTYFGVEDEYKYTISTEPIKNPYE